MVVVIKLVWMPWWTQADGPREYAPTPLGISYHVSELGWWTALAYLNKCVGMDAAKAGAQADFDAKVRECVE